VFTARYGLGPYIKQTGLAFKGLKSSILNFTYYYGGFKLIISICVFVCAIILNVPCQLFVNKHIPTVITRSK
jgi:hypothetical protein